MMVDIGSEGDTFRGYWGSDRCTEMSRVESLLQEILKVISLS